jgi:hypothetical protein
MAGPRHSPSRPPVRLRAAPPLDPPFDDEPGVTWTSGGQLALDFAASTRAPAGVRPPGSAPLRGRRPAPPVGPPQASVAASMEARRAAHRFLTTCLEIFNGYRTVAHIRPLTNRGELHEVIQQLSAALERLTVLRRRAVGRRQPVRLRRVRVCEPRSGAAEAAAVLDIGGHVWAAAFRVERRHGSWVATAFRLL